MKDAFEGSAVPGPCRFLPWDETVCDPNNLSRYISLFFHQ
jgi:hypothetical protein